MDTTLAQEINDQIGREFHAAYQYLAMSAWFETQSLPGFATWLREQAREEITHAMKLFDFMTEAGERPDLPAVAKPTVDFASPLAVFEAALAHEQSVTRSITKLYELAMQQAHYPLQMLLQWFVTEQLEEEQVTGAVVDRLRLGNGDGTALLIIDNELATRGATAEPAHA